MSPAPPTIPEATPEPLAAAAISRSTAQRNWPALRIAGIIAALVLCYFWFPRSPGPPSMDASDWLADVRFSEQEKWMAIEHDHRRIGFSYRSRKATESGWQIREQTRMHLTTMGLSQPLDLETEADLNPDGSLLRFKFSLHSGRFVFVANGHCEDDRLIVRHGSQRMEIALSEPIYLPATLLQIAAAQNPLSGHRQNFQIFDPASMSRQAVTIAYHGKQPLEMGNGKTIRARHFQLEFMGASYDAWMDDKGSVLRENGPLGITLVQSSRDEISQNPQLHASRDLTRMVSIDAGRAIERPEQYREMVVAMTGIDRPLDISGDRQRLEGRHLTITLENTVHRDPLDETERNLFLQPTATIQSDAPEIRKLAAEIVTPQMSPREAATKLLAWVYHHIEKRPVISVPDALTTLKNRTGDCNEHAVLLTALARAAGIPAQIEAGLVYLDGRFYYHAWNVLYLDGWTTVDALMNQMPADVTHVRLVRGDAARQTDLIGIIGKIDLDVVSLR